jgi:hypothetical protein
MVNPPHSHGAGFAAEIFLAQSRFFCVYLRCALHSFNEGWFACPLSALIRALSAPICVLGVMHSLSVDLIRRVEHNELAVGKSG